MINGIHFLLTLKCTNECDHCFLYCKPDADGTFTLSQVKNVLAEAKKTGSVCNIFFEGGEPFLYYQLLLESIKAAKELSFDTSIVTNCYWAVTPDDAEVNLNPLKNAGLDSISFSEDTFHSGDTEDEKPGNAKVAAEKLGINADIICIEEPSVKTDSGRIKGEPVVGGSTCFKGRAADKLTEGLPSTPWETFTSCEDEELIDPGRYHVDAFGNVHVCQGLSIGNMWDMPFADLIATYDPHSHPIIKHLVEGGPAQLAKTYDMIPEGGFIDRCHFCFNVRRMLIDRFPQFLAPKLVYGL